MSAPLFCPECESEYLPSATECADCRVPLVHEHELGASPADDLPPASELTLLRAASIGWVRSLSDRLSEAGLPHRIEAAVSDDEDTQRPGASLPYGVYLRPDDVPAALEVDADFMREQIPDLPEHVDVSAGGGEGCPACGDAVPANANECPSCGLALVFDE